MFYRVLDIENLGGALANHPVANFQSCHARVGYWVNTGKYTPSRAGPIPEKPVLAQLHCEYILPYCPSKGLWCGSFKNSLENTLCSRSLYCQSCFYVFHRWLNENVLYCTSLNCAAVYLPALHIWDYCTLLYCILSYFSPLAFRALMKSHSTDFWVFSNCWSLNCFNTLCLITLTCRGPLYVVKKKYIKIISRDIGTR